MTGEIYDIVLDRAMMLEKGFTDTHIDILQEMAKENTSTQGIADALGVSYSTVKNAMGNQSGYRDQNNYTLGIMGNMEKLTGSTVEREAWIPTLLTFRLARRKKRE